MVNQRIHEARIIENLPLAYKVATRFSVQTEEDIEELKAASVAGLVEASLRFDPEAGAKFSTYAWYWCRKYAAEAYRVLRAPVSTSHTSAQVYGVGMERYGDDSDGDVEIVMTPDILVELSPEVSVLNSVVHETMVNSVLRMMDACLNETEAACVRLYHGIDCIPMNTSEISKVMGFSRQAAHQNMTRGVDKLREGFGVSAA